MHRFTCGEKKNFGKPQKVLRYYETDCRYGLFQCYEFLLFSQFCSDELLDQYNKRVKTKSQKALEGNSYL